MKNKSIDDSEVLVQNALKNLNNPDFRKTLPSIFKLNDLVDWNIWNNTKPKIKQQAGKKFKNYIISNPHFAKFVDKGSDNHSRYELI